MLNFNTQDLTYINTVICNRRGLLTRVEICRIQTREMKFLRSTITRLGKE